MDLQVVPLHKYSQYSVQCCQLINEEWKRSVTARMRSLECSCDTLPTCLILLKDEKVIGHCKLSVIPSICDACFIESVVIDKLLRGKGYGSYLMTKAEEYCKNALNLKTIYLSTKGQELFYSKLGYDKCQPISIYGSSSIVNFPMYHVHHTTKNIKQIANENNSPIPPPMPKTTMVCTEITSKVYMKKEL